MHLLPDLFAPLLHVACSIVPLHQSFVVWLVLATLSTVMPSVVSCTGACYACVLCVCADLSLGAPCCAVCSCALCCPSALLRWSDCRCGRDAFPCFLLYLVGVCVMRRHVLFHPVVCMVRHFPSSTFSLSFWIFSAVLRCRMQVSGCTCRVHHSSPHVFGPLSSSVCVSACILFALASGLGIFSWGPWLSFWLPSSPPRQGLLRGAVT